MAGLVAPSEKVVAEKIPATEAEFRPLVGGRRKERPMMTVYVLESERRPGFRYKGVTRDLPARVARHNDGEVPSTAPYRPWRLTLFIAFDQDSRAFDFERYLKSGSGHAFAKKHFW
jgi:putative endonuclease